MPWSVRVKYHTLLRANCRNNYVLPLPLLWLLTSIRQPTESKQTGGAKGYSNERGSNRMSVNMAQGMAWPKSDAF
jgi:hypothetical protein